MLDQKLRKGSGNFHFMQRSVEPDWVVLLFGHPLFSHHNTHTHLQACTYTHVFGQSPIAPTSLYWIFVWLSACAASWHPQAYRHVAWSTDCAFGVEEKAALLPHGHKPVPGLGLGKCSLSWTLAAPLQGQPPCAMCQLHNCPGAEISGWSFPDIMWHGFGEGGELEVFRINQRGLFHILEMWLVIVTGQWGPFSPR